MLTWSHYAFRQHLLFKARSMPHCRVVICTEEYTTMTCGRCWTENDHVGGDEIFRCVNEQCLIDGRRVRMDRDVQAARNILIKVITEGYVALQAAIAEAEAAAPDA
jgi:transposase